jgi:hypothetical protein
MDYECQVQTVLAVKQNKTESETVVEELKKTDPDPDTGKKALASNTKKGS